ncbi:MAG: hypothetical protein ACK4QL_00495 [Pseudanabaenaceae cyanobacterium]
MTNIKNIYSAVVARYMLNLADRVAGVLQSEADLFGVVVQVLWGTTVHLPESSP